MRLRGQLKKFLYGKCPLFAGSFPYFGVKVFFPEKSQIFDLACRNGTFEWDNVAILQTAVADRRDNALFFDIGANIGLMSIPILLNCPDCRVVSYEPSPSTFPFLARTVKGSHYYNRWTAVQKAVGATAGEAKFQLAAPGFEALEGFRDTGRASTTTSVMVPVTTIDLEWKSLGCPRVAAIKIDIEGAEWEALQGATECIQSCRPCILTEWCSTNLRAYERDPSAILEFATKFDYRLFSLPTITAIGDAQVLGLHMIRSESFLLAPRSCNGEAGCY